MNKLLTKCILGCLAISGVCTAQELIQSAEPPVIPIGEDAYLMWDRMGQQRIGIRGMMRSTYDRHGYNRTADASHFLYQESDTFNVTLDTKGPGILYFKRANHWHGSPWHYEVDGEDFIVKETATADPVTAKKTLKHTEFIPQDLFPHPLTWTWSTTKGADLMWVPIAFEDSFRMAYSRTFYGTGYYIYHMLSPGMKHLSKPFESWKKTPPDPAVLDLINKAGTDIAPKGPDVTRLEGTVALKANETHLLAELNQSPASIRALKFSVPRDQAYNFGKCWIRITWDHRKHASVEAPIALFFGAGHLYNNNDREYLVKGLPMVIRYDKETVELNCYYPMVFFKHAKIELIEKNAKPLNNIQWEIRTVDYKDPINHTGYFHATYSDFPTPEPGKDMTFLDTEGVEGSKLWSGNFVGMSFIFSRNGNLVTLEGDPRFLFDDSQTPQAWGTGTEEWGGGGDYWGGRNMTIPFAGYPVGTKKKGKKPKKKDLLNSAYRFLVADLFPFGRRAVINLEHGGQNQSKEHYSGVVYWYGIDSPSLLLTDQFDPCDPQDIQKHNYESPSAKEPYSLESRYELGPDHFLVGERMKRTPENELTPGAHHGTPGPVAIYPAQEDQVRIMTGTSRFTMNLNPQNLGVLLRRKFDYLYPNQCAKVSVRPAGSDKPWQYVGEWYTAGANTCVWSRPRTGELAETEHHVITSDRRWREEEFLIPRHMTEGVESLEIKLEHVPNTKELFPGHPFPGESAWSEARYWAYCYQMPTVKLSK